MMAWLIVLGVVMLGWKIYWIFFTKEKDTNHETTPEEDEQTFSF